MSKLSLKRRKQVIERDGYKCAYCAVDLSFETEKTDVGPWFYVPVGEWPSVDHVVPTARGGTDDDSNLVASCFPCNSQKGGRTGDEYRAWKMERGL